MFRKSLSLLVVAGLLATFGLLASAYFTSTATVGNNTFTTGTLNLTASPTSAALTLSNMAPGDKVTAPITLTNAGTLDLYYAMTSNSTNGDNKGLAQQMTLAIKSGVTACTNGGFDASGTALYNGSLQGASFGNSDFENFGWPQPGDRLLTATALEVLCFQVMLPTSTGNPYQGATTTTTFTFNAIQTTH
jgi:predicted ribosomally synthesized peptide with SipW-like signal peptide